MAKRQALAGIEPGLLGSQFGLSPRYAVVPNTPLRTGKFSPPAFWFIHLFGYLALLYLKGEGMIRGEGKVALVAMIKKTCLIL